MSLDRSFYGVVTNRLFPHFEMLAKEDFTIFNRNYHIPYRLHYYFTSINKCIYFINFIMLPKLLHALKSHKYNFITAMTS